MQRAPQRAPFPLPKNDVAADLPAHFRIMRLLRSFGSQQGANFHILKISGARKGHYDDNNP